MLALIPVPLLSRSDAFSVVVVVWQVQGGSAGTGDSEEAVGSRSGEQATLRAAPVEFRDEGPLVSRVRISEYESAGGSEEVWAQYWDQPYSRAFLRLAAFHGSEALEKLRSASLRHQARQHAGKALNPTRLSLARKPIPSSPPPPYISR